MLYKGYVETKGKASIEKLKNRTKWKTYEEVKNLSGFGGVLADDTILIDIDDSEQSEILMNIVEDLQLDCKVLCTSRGKHFLFKNHTIARNRTHVQLAVGLTADITGINQDRVVLELARIAFVKMTDLVDSHGRIKDGASEDDLACIESVKYKQSESETGSSVEREVKISPKLKALELLGKHLGMWNDKLDVNITQPIVITGEDALED